MKWRYPRGPFHRHDIQLPLSGIPPGGLGLRARLRSRCQQRRHGVQRVRRALEPIQETVLHGGRQFGQLIQDFPLFFAQNLTPNFVIANQRLALVWQSALVPALRSLRRLRGPCCDTRAGGLWLIS